MGVWGRMSGRGKLSGRYGRVKREEVVRKVDGVKRWIDGVEDVGEVGDGRVGEGEGEEDGGGMGIMGEDRGERVVERRLGDEGRGGVGERRMGERGEMGVREGERGLWGLVEGRGGERE